MKDVISLSLAVDAALRGITVNMEILRLLIVQINLMKV